MFSTNQTKKLKILEVLACMVTCSIILAPLGTNSNLKTLLSRQVERYDMECSVADKISDCLSYLKHLSSALNDNKQELLTLDYESLHTVGREISKCITVCNGFRKELSREQTEQYSDYMSKVKCLNETGYIIIDDNFVAYTFKKDREDAIEKLHKYTSGELAEKEYDELLNIIFRSSHIGLDSMIIANILDEEVLKSLQDYCDTELMEAHNGSSRCDFTELQLNKKYLSSMLEKIDNLISLKQTYSAANNSRKSRKQSKS